MQFNIISSPWMTTSEKKIVPRTWRERLFSWPWRPWQATKVKFEVVLIKEVYVMGNDIVCHPVVAEQMRSLYGDPCTVELAKFPATPEEQYMGKMMDLQLGLLHYAIMSCSPRKRREK